MASKGNLEIERRWFLQIDTFNPDFELSDFKSVEIKQWYITTNPVLRLRSQDDKEFVLCVKTRGEKGKNKGVPEMEINLLKEEFETLFLKVDKKRPIFKRRYYIPLSNGLVAEVDIMMDYYTGIIFIEVEFPDKESADKFVPPSWFGEEEVTGKYEYSNSNLYKEMPDFESNNEEDEEECIKMVFGDKFTVFKKFNDEDENDAEFLRDNNNRVKLGSGIFAEEWDECVDYEKSYATIEDGKLIIMVYGIPSFINKQSVINYFKKTLDYRITTGYGEFFETEEGCPICMIVEHNDKEVIV